MKEMTFLAISAGPFAPVVAAIRDALHEETGEWFDCALLNHYPDGSVACKYHTDPDLGRLWAGAYSRPLLGSTQARFVGYVGSVGGISDIKWLMLS